MICVRDCGSIVGPSKSARRAQLKTESKMKCVLLAPGSQNRTTIAKKSIQNTIIFMMRLGINFRTGFGGSSRPKWNQVGTKIYQKGTKITFLGRLEIVSGPPGWHLGTLGRPTFPPTLPRTFPRMFPRTFYWQLEPQLGSQNDAKMANKSS